jgi:hypothetical protein
VRPDERVEADLADRRGGEAAGGEDDRSEVRILGGEVQADRCGADDGRSREASTRSARGEARRAATAASDARTTTNPAAKAT